MNKVDHSYLLKKWTKEEKEIVLKHRMNGFGPKKIADFTGFPLNQIKFWIYGTRTNKRSKKSKNHNSNNVRAYYRQKETNWVSWKTQCVRQTSIRISKKFKSSDIPTIKQIEEWLLKIKLQCSYCLVQLDEKTFSVDHANPVSRGGSLMTENFRECCSSCNLIKGTLNELEYKSLLVLLEDFEDKGKALKGRLKRGFFR